MKISGCKRGIPERFDSLHVQIEVVGEGLVFG